MVSITEPTSLYPYDPSHVLPAVFSVLIGISLIVHIWQNFRYRFWRVTFFMIWGGAIFTSGWILRCISSYNPTNLNLYIAQTCLILGGPPVYSAAEYNILGRLMYYLPMHAPLHPARLVFFFIYLGALVESLTAAGGARMAVSPHDLSAVRSGSNLVFAACVLQIVLECLFMSMVAIMHHRCVRSRMLTPNIRNICIVLYGTSTLVLIRNIFRAIEKYSIVSVLSSGGNCTGVCKATLRQEWYIYVFEAAPMVLYTFWLNVMHPAKFLPSKHDRYLDFNKEERVGPGWIDKRPKINTFVDPFDIEGLVTGRMGHEKFWELSNDWPIAADGSFAKGTATNVRKGK